MIMNQVYPLAAVCTGIHEIFIQQKKSAYVIWCDQLYSNSNNIYATTCRQSLLVTPS